VGSLPATPNRAKVCARCGWTTFPQAQPNGSAFTVEWREPECCGRCGTQLELSSPISELQKI